MHCLGYGMVEADGVYGRVVGRRLVAMAAGRVVQAPLHCAAAQMLRLASWLPRCAHWCHLRSACWILRRFLDVELADLVDAAVFIIKEGLWLWRFITVSDKFGIARSVGFPSWLCSGPEEFMGELLTVGAVRALGL